ncbi:MAG: LptF/LptG family permease [Nitrospirota bacterium]|nr:LptF/LptG family permease [Nitrospirota bacterium]
MIKPRILTRHLLGEYLKIYFLSLVSLEAIYLVIDSVEKIKDFLAHHAAWSLMAEFFAYRSIEVGFRVVPMAALLATILSLGIASKNHEITAIKAAGISLRRATFPIILFGLLLSGFELLLNIWIVPHAYQMTDIITEERIHQGKDWSGSTRKNVWFRHGDQEIFKIQRITDYGRTLKGVIIYHRNRQSELHWSIMANRLVYQNGEWVFRKGTKTLFHRDGTLTTLPFDTLPFPLDRKPDDFFIRKTHLSHLTYFELQRYIDLMKANGLPHTNFTVLRDGIIAFPAASFLMVLFAIPFGIREGRQVGVARGFGVALLLSLAYWTLYSMGLALGRGGVVPPLLSAWFANIVVFIVGISLMTSMNRV